VIRVLHLADLHIGVETYGRIDPTTGLHTRLLDYLQRLDEALDIGRNKGVDLVLIAGDIYKNRIPNPTHQREFAKRVGELCNEGIAVFLLTGNHDVSSSAGRAHSVEIFDTLRVKGVTVADRPYLHTIATRKGPIQIIAMPWVTRHNLLTRDDMHMASFQKINDTIQERVEEFIAHKCQELDPTTPAILTMHATVDGAQIGAERGMTLGQEMIIPQSVVANPAVDYVAMGHIHRHQAIGETPPIVYAGSIERIDFGERDETKGCVIVDVEKGDAQWMFYPLAARPFRSLSLDLRSRNVSALPTLLERAIARQPLENAIVRVRVQATGEQAVSVDEEHIRRQLEEAGAFLIASVSVEVDSETRRRFADAEQEIIQGLSPQRALELFFQAKEIPPERMNQLLGAVDELLREEVGTQDVTQGTSSPHSYSHGDPEHEDEDVVEGQIEPEK
jgi:exonuclease SbcD